MQRVTSKAWFGPKRFFGWGWTIKSWEGAAVTVAFIALLAVALSALSGVGRIAAAVVVLAAFFAVVLVTGDPPGNGGGGSGPPS